MSFGWAACSFTQLASHIEVGTPGTSVQNVGQNTMVVLVRSDFSDCSKRNVVKEEGSRITLVGTVGSNK